MELRYARHPGTQHCPDESALRSAVLAHLGYDPFVARDGRRVIVVTLHRTARGLRAQIDSVGARGKIEGARSLDSPSADCRELVSSVALAVSIAIDPLHASAPAPAPPVSLPPSPAPAPVVEAAPERPEHAEEIAPPEPAPKKPERHYPTVPIVSAAFVSGIGTAPAVSFGGAAEVRLRHDTLSLGLGARADAPTSATATLTGATGARVQSSLVVGSVAPCWHRDPLALCTVADFGALSGTATNVAISEHHSTFFSAVGARVSFAWPLASLLSIGVYAEALVPVTPTTLRIDHVDAWSTPAVAGDLGLQVSVPFP